MKKLLCLALVLAAVMPLCAKGGGDKGAANQVSGNVVIYTSMYENVIEAVKQELSARFPEYTIEFIYGGTGQLQAKVAAEQESGRLKCDMLMVAEPAYSLELKETGILHSYKSAEASGLAFNYDPDGFWYPVRISNMVLAYNPEKFDRGNIPLSFYDFAYKPGGGGTISMSNPLTSGTAMATVTALRDKYGYEYFEALGGQGVAIESGSVALQKLETGEHKVIMILEESILQKRQEEKSKLEVIYPADGVVVIPSTIMIINDRWSANRNIPAAQAVAEWFLSPAGQNAIVDGWMHSVRAGFDRYPYDAPPTDTIRENSIPVNWENCLNQRDEIRDSFEEYITGRQ
jgi:iron(III) transport system substrate-binding protein